MSPGGGDFEERRNHERSFAGVGVWHRQSPLVARPNRPPDTASAMHDDVDVERARPPDPASAAASLALDALGGEQQGERSARPVTDGCCVYVGGLWSWPERRSRVGFRHGFDCEPAAHKPPQGSANRSCRHPEPPGNVGAEGQQCCFASHFRGLFPFGLPACRKAELLHRCYTIAARTPSYRLATVRPADLRRAADTLG